MKLAATLALLLLVAAACGSDSPAELSGPVVGDYPESLAFSTAENEDLTVDTGAATAPMTDSGDGSDAPMATFDEVRGDESASEAESPGPAEIKLDFRNDAPACIAIAALASGSMTNAADVAAAFEDIAGAFPSPVLGPLEIALMGDSGAAADLFLDPDGVIDHLRLDAQTYATCGVPLFAATLGEAGPTEGEGDCFTASPLDDSAKVAVGAELNEDVAIYVRVACDG